MDKQMTETDIAKCIKDVEQEVKKYFGKEKNDKEIGSEYCKYALDYVYKGKFKQALEYTNAALKYDPDNIIYLEFKKILEQEKRIDIYSIVKNKFDNGEYEKVVEIIKKAEPDVRLEEILDKAIQCLEDKAKEYINKRFKNSYVYNNAMEYYNNGKFFCAYNYINRNIHKFESVKLQNLLNKLKKHFDTNNKEEVFNIIQNMQIDMRFKEIFDAYTGDEVYSEARKLYFNGYYTKAKSLIKEKAKTNAKFKELLNEIEKKLTEGNNKENLANEYFNKALVILERKEQGTIEDVKAYLTKAMEIDNNVLYSNMLDTIDKLLDNNFDLSKGCIKVTEIAPNGDFAMAVSFNSETISEEELSKGGTLKDTEIQLEKQRKQAEDLYTRGMNKLNNNDFDGAIADLTEAVGIDPDINDIYQTALAQAQESKAKFDEAQKTKPISLETTTKEELLTIDGFDDEKADKFMQELENGKKYYNLETFAADFELQPHQMILLEDRLIFSQKPANKFGRKVDL